MIISHHQICVSENVGATFIPSPNVRRGKLDHRYLLIHYTASSSLESAVDWLTSPASGCSAHVVIGRSGEIIQLVPFDGIALHAGRSRWRGVEGLNGCSIGIELENAGCMERQGGRWRAWFGGDYGDGDVMEATHKYGSRLLGWHMYTDKQIEAVCSLTRLLVDVYDLDDVIGHDDVAPYRKMDPGPAFPMDAIRGRALGRASNALELYDTTTVLNIRYGPGVTYPRLPGSPLARATRLRMVAVDNDWCSVEVIGDDGHPCLTGWVHGAYIRRAA
jgi:N-acetylmuramoyl-L-alanine amidase